MEKNIKKKVARGGANAVLEIVADSFCFFSKC